MESHQLSPTLPKIPQQANHQQNTIRTNRRNKTTTQARRIQDRRLASKIRLSTSHHYKLTSRSIHQRHLQSQPLPAPSIFQHHLYPLNTENRRGHTQSHLRQPKHRTPGNNRPPSLRRRTNQRHMQNSTKPMGGLYQLHPHPHQRQRHQGTKRPHLHHTKATRRYNPTDLPSHQTKRTLP
jgi:hypothetical protein